MVLNDKIIKALLTPLNAEYVRLDNDDGISGYVVSRTFEGKSSLDRQELIEQALNQSSDPFTPAELSQVLLIAGLTPTEYESVGARIRVHKVRELDGASFEILLHGGLSDAEYVRGALNNHQGIQSTVPQQVVGALGVLMSFRVTGPSANPLTKEKVIQVLQGDRYIQVMPNA